jgi:hypothetical protein
LAIGATVLRRIGVKWNASRAYAIGKLIDEGGIEKIMRAMFYPPERQGPTS